MKQSRVRAPQKKSGRTGANQSGSNTVQVAVWKEGHEDRRALDGLNQEAFYDFSRPLRLLDSSGWGGQIKATSDGQGFFVFSSQPHSVDYPS